MQPQDATTSLGASTPRPERIGPYRILQVLGEGGMGTVYVAEQSAPISRRVALKVLKLGMDTPQFIARFEAERQALAVMDHPCIARVYDAGATESGRPYLVMELVHGVPITDYCDTHRLDTRQRVALMSDVCQTVQHAHLKGVIHRDLKPSNVLVGLQDGRAVPKIIDFGVAKAIDRKLTSVTLYTEIGQRIGTPAYMSPEQMEMSGLDVDTRTDIYSLGIMLYELLAGALPFSNELLQRAVGRPELLRETDTPTPSSRVTSHGDLASTIAARRRCDATSLRNQIKGDLDWITLKAIAKDRTDRYETANGLAMDLRRYLEFQPVVARPPNTRDRVSKFVHRHRAGVSVAIVVLALMIAATIGLSVLAQRLAVERDRAASEAARASSIATFLQDTLSSADPWSGGNRNATVRDALAAASATVDRSFQNQPLDAAAVRRTIAVTYAGLGLWEEAERLARAALDTQRASARVPDEEMAKTLGVLADVQDDRGKYVEAEASAREALAIRQSLNGQEHEAAAQSLNQLAGILQKRGQYKEAAAAADNGLAIRRRRLGPRDESVADSLKRLASIVAGASADYARADTLLREAVDIRRSRGRDSVQLAVSLNDLAVNDVRRENYDAAESLHREALTMQRRLLGDEHPEVLITLENLGLVYLRTKRYDETFRLLDEILAMRRKHLGDDHTTVARTLANIGTVKLVVKDYPAAVTSLSEAIARLRTTLGSTHAELVNPLLSLGDALHGAGSPDAAETRYREALTIGLKAYPADDHPEIARGRRQLGNLLVADQRFAEAEPLLLAAAAAREKRLGRDHATTRAVVADVVKLYDVWNKPDKAAEWRQRAGAR
jgi:serine/threonine protein kinase